MANNKFTEELKIRVTPEFKVKITSIAKEGGISVSDYIRNTLESEEKITLLTDGHKIAEGLYKLNILLAEIKKLNNLSAKDKLDLICSVEELNRSIIELTKSLSTNNEKEMEE